MKRIGYFLIGILTGVAVTAFAQQQLEDAVLVSPDYYSVRLDNARVRVLEYRLKPGEREQMHTHSPSVAYIVTAAKLRTTTPGGQVAEGVLNAGDVHWRDNSVVHAVENIGKTEARAIIVELKDTK